MSASLIFNQHSQKALPSQFPEWRSSRTQTDGSFADIVRFILVSTKYNWLMSFQHFQNLSGPDVDDKQQHST